MYEGRSGRFTKLIDRVLGIPFLLFASLLIRKKRLPQDIKKITLIKTAAIGDMLLLQPFVSALKRQYDNCFVTVVSGNDNYEMAEIISADRVISINHRKLFDVVRNLRSIEKQDVVLDFGQWPRFDAFAALLIKSLFRAGFKTEGQHRHFIYDEFVIHSSEIHEIDNFNNLFRVVCEENQENPKIDIECKNFDEEYYVFHMFAGGSNYRQKMWPDYKWVELADNLGKRVYFTGTPHFNHVADIIAGNCKNGVNAVGLSLKDTICLIKNASALVSVNTGIMHIGCALGVKTVAINGPTDSRRWGAWGKNCINVDSSHECSPCLNLGFEFGCDKCDCMDMIEVQEVYDAIMDGE